MQLLVVDSAALLVIKARMALGMSQRKLAETIGSSIRTVARMEGGRSTPSASQYQTLAPLLHPVDPDLAHDAAAFCGATLESLGIAKPAPPPEPVPVTTPPPLLPTRVLVDALVYAAADSLGASSAGFERVRAALRAAFAHARDLHLDPADVVEALTPAAHEAEPQYFDPSERLGGEAASETKNRRVQPTTDPRALKPKSRVASPAARSIRS